jgi:hypothetical protein
MNLQCERNYLSVKDNLCYIQYVPYLADQREATIILSNKIHFLIKAFQKLFALRALERYDPVEDGPLQPGRHAIWRGHRSRYTCAMILVPFWSLQCALLYAPTQNAYLTRTQSRHSHIRLTQTTSQLLDNVHGMILLMCDQSYGDVIWKQCGSITYVLTD